MKIPGPPKNCVPLVCLTMVVTFISFFALLVSLYWAGEAHSEEIRMIGAWLHDYPEIKHVVETAIADDYVTRGEFEGIREAAVRANRTYEISKIKEMK